MATVTAAEALQAILSGKFVTVEFVKRTDGTLRVMNCRYGVRQHVLGTGSSYEPKDKGLVCVWDCKLQQYRMIPLEGLQRIKFKGEWKEVERDQPATQGQ